ncbi:MAG TPA: hypothetical protein DDX71_00345 [Ruminococcus sp.]|nr:hypothetical protein [Ruminococcus sp.]
METAGMLSGIPAFFLRRASPADIFGNAAHFRYPLPDKLCKMTDAKSFACHYVGNTNKLAKYLFHHVNYT